MINFYGVDLFKIFAKLVSHIQLLYTILEMTILNKVTFVVFVGILIFIWNKYVIPFMIRKVVELNSNNSWLKRNEEILIKGYQGFFWVGFGMIILTMILSR